MQAYPRNSICNLLSMRAVLFSACIGMLALVSACSRSQNEDEDLENGKQESRIIKMIDERRYDEVIRLLQSRQDNEKYRKLIPYLAMAHLGAAHFEPLQIAANVLAAQGSGPTDWDTLIPGCDNAAKSQYSNLEVKCLLKRLWRNLPDANDPHFAEARRILETLFPDAASTPKKYCLLTGLVEASSVISRVGRILLRYAALDAQAASADSEIKWIFEEISKSAGEANSSLRYAQYTARRTNELLTGLERSPLFVQNHITIAWTEETGLPLVQQIAHEGAVEPNDSIMKATLLQRLDQLIAKLRGQ